MNTEDKLRKAIREYADRIPTDPAAWVRIDERMLRGSSAAHRFVVAFVTAAALGGLIVIRVAADRPGAVEFFDPAPTASPTTQPTDTFSSPTPAAVPSDFPTPVASPSFPLRVYVTPTGGWEFHYPVTWSAHESGSADYLIINNELEKLDAIKMDLADFANEDGLTTQSMLDRECDEASQDPPAEVLGCETLEINGSRWGRVELFTQFHGPTRIIHTFHVTATRIYSSAAYLFGTSKYGDRTAQVEEIVSSFVIRGG